MSSRLSNTKAVWQRAAPVLLCVAAASALVPTAGWALAGLGDAAASDNTTQTFTPANVDPALALRVAQRIEAKGLALRFTPASSAARNERPVTVAVRVDDKTAKAISIRTAINSVIDAEAGRDNRLPATVAVAPTRYNLGVSRGYQSFAKPSAVSPVDLPASLAGPKSLSGKVRDISMPDLSSYKSSVGGNDKPSRFQPRIALEQQARTGRTPSTLQGLGEQSVDVGGAYSITRNLDVTAGVRVSQDRARLAPLTDTASDDQAVYVGTQFRF
ncbi:hypothetical protein HME9302_02507 [Alteripontixanthobacter maritimus]|uniref:Porin domain-containing protein n=1 Tax=Alteripontixanthobacter maritimus TaxID=2161824 RepID=A0A369QDI6_9SPHN|nr:hypothetical protein [Alteripontixanthobacter maritimus]RDC61286.1 hypothetical protein HME9302_02507 [Alteripontixanthobacter maritimus]